MKTSAVGTYLNDHFAGPAMAISAAKNRLERTENPALATYLREFIGQLREERAQLRQIIQALGFTVSYSKALSAWVAEKATRLKLVQLLEGGPSDLAEFEQLELLRLGVQGKRGLWSYLLKLAATESRLRGFHLKKLLLQADHQIEALETFRLEAGELRDAVSERPAQSPAR